MLERLIIITTTSRVIFSRSIDIFLHIFLPKIMYMRKYVKKWQPIKAVNEAALLKNESVPFDTYTPADGSK